MIYEDVMSRLESLGSDKGRKINAKNGVAGDQFGAKMGDLRVIAKEIKKDRGLADQLWGSRNFDARMVATLLLQSETLTISEIVKYVSEIDCPPLADWFVSCVVKQNRDRETVREEWMQASHEITARLGWSLTAERIVKSPEGLDLPGLLTRLELEMPSAPSSVQWAMNYCLAEIGIHFGDLRDRALAIGERIGAFRDYPTSKGCVSPFAPIWIAEMVSRNG